MNGRRAPGRNFNRAQPLVANRSADQDCRGDVKCHYLAEFRETLQHHQAFGQDGPACHGATTEGFEAGRSIRIIARAPTEPLQSVAESSRSPATIAASVAWRPGSRSLKL
jgi:hypothetical protein